jgi:hypothetical protein
VETLLKAALAKGTDARKVDTIMSAMAKSPVFSLYSHRPLAVIFHCDYRSHYSPPQQQSDEQTQTELAISQVHLSHCPSLPLSISPTVHLSHCHTVIYPFSPSISPTVPPSVCLSLCLCVTLSRCSSLSLSHCPTASSLLLSLSLPLDVSLSLSPSLTHSASTPFLALSFTHSAVLF